MNEDIKNAEIITNELLDINRQIEYRILSFAERSNKLNYNKLKTLLNKNKDIIDNFISIVNKVIN